jgi:hypothetical protein
VATLDAGFAAAAQTRNPLTAPAERVEGRRASGNGCRRETVRRATVDGREERSARL